MVTPTTGHATLPDSDLDPEVRKFIRSVNRAMAELPAVAGAPHVQRRVRAETVRALWATGGPEMAASSDQTVSTTAGAVRLRIHKPGNGLSPALVYLHGGGWTMFSVDTHDRLMREYAARAGCAVVGIDYALSPEARYPTALTQVVDVLCWLQRNGHGLGIDASRLAIGGDSAGANLAVASCLALRDSKNAGLPLAMILSYGAFSTACSSHACRRYGGPDYMLSCEEMSGFWRDYLRNEADAQDPLACPLLARLDGLPAVFLGIAECDILAEQNLQMAARLQAAGVPVVSRIYRGASHSFLEAVSVARVSDRALTDAATWLGCVLDTH